MSKVYQLMEKHIIGVSRDSTLAAVLKLMQGSKVSIVPVVERSTLVGIVTRKMVEDDNGAHEKVGQIMKKPIFVKEDDDITKAVKEMLYYSISRVPVVNNRHEMHCVGLITSTQALVDLKN